MIKFFRIIMNAILVLVIVMLCIYFALRATNKVIIYSVKTGSMEDKIHVGDYILIIKQDDYEVGDVVTFESGDGFITHRIIKINKNTITTKGDANNIEDDNIDKKNIVGKVIISGGILNTIINYKYIIVSFILSMYLFSCYFGNKNCEKVTKEK